MNDSTEKRLENASKQSHPAHQGESAGLNRNNGCRKVRSPGLMRAKIPRSDGVVSPRLQNRSNSHGYHHHADHGLRHFHRSAHGSHDQHRKNQIHRKHDYLLRNQGKQRGCRNGIRHTIDQIGRSERLLFCLILRFGHFGCFAAHNVFLHLELFVVTTRIFLTTN